jgi:hypothetical protein
VRRMVGFNFRYLALLDKYASVSVRLVDGECVCVRAASKKNYTTGTHTHIHTQRKRERERVLPCRNARSHSHSHNQQPTDQPTLLRREALGNLAV